MLPVLVTRRWAYNLIWYGVRDSTGNTRWFKRDKRAAAAHLVRLIRDHRSQHGV